MRHGKSIRQRKEELGFTNLDSDESTHDLLDEIERLHTKSAEMRRALEVMLADFDLIPINDVVTAYTMAHAALKD